MSEKKKFKLNIFDIVIVVIVLCIGVGLYVFTHRETTIDTKKLTYKIELNDAAPGLADYIHEGDHLYENTKNYSMGNVVSVERVIITVTANVTETDSAYAVNGQYIVRAGNEIFVKGPGYAGEGYVIQIER